MSSTKMCGASATSPAVPCGKVAAKISAIEPPSLWPRSRRVGLAVDVQHGEKSRQQLARLLVHEARRPAFIGGPGRGPPVTRTRVDEPPEPAGVAQSCGKSRHVDSDPSPSWRNTNSGAERRSGFSHPYSMSTDRRDKARHGRCAHVNPASRSRSAKRWIFPVAVFGSSAGTRSGADICRARAGPSRKPSGLGECHSRRKLPSAPRTPWSS